MVNYQDGKIYKIVDNTNDTIYVGSTCEPFLSRRLAGHVGKYKSYLNGKGNFVTSFLIIENNNYDIVLIENFPCTNKDELYARESYHCQSLVCVNKVKHQGLLNKLGKKAYKDLHYQGHKEEYKQCYQENKTNINNQHKQYYNQNKTHLNNQHKQYYNENKDDLKEKANIKHTCDCGGKYTHQNKTRHIKSIKHQSYLSSI
jgi:hypothetical protein